MPAIVRTVQTILSIADQFTPEIKNAYFKYPSASLESLDYDSRQIKKSTIINLASMGFISNATNLIRRLIEQITVHESGTFTVEFKSGTKVEV